MWYIIKSDLLNILSYKKRYIAVYFLVIIFYFLYSKSFALTQGNDLLNRMLGLHFSTESDLISISLYFYTLSSFLYFAIYLFSKDLKNGIDNLFLRIQPNNWLVIKLISITLITLVIKIFAYLLTTLLVGLDALDVIQTIRLFWSDIICISIIQNLLLLLHILAKKNIGWFLLCFSFLALFDAYFGFLDATRTNDYIVQSLLVLLGILIALAYIFSRNYYVVFEIK